MTQAVTIASPRLGAVRQSTNHASHATIRTGKNNRKYPFDSASSTHAPPNTTSHRLAPLAR